MMENLEQMLDEYVKLTLDIMGLKAERDKVHDKIEQVRSSNGHKEIPKRPWECMDKYSPAPPKAQDDILALLHPEHGRTVKSLMTLTNRGHSYCYERLRRLQTAGKARVEVPRDCREPHRWFAI